MRQAGLDVGVIAPRLTPIRSIWNHVFNEQDIQFECDNGVPTYRAAQIHFTPKMWVTTAKRQSKVVWRLFEAYRLVHGLPDIIQLHASLPAGLGAIQIGKKFNIPVVISEHRSAFARDMVSRAGTCLARKIVSASAARFAVSGSFARILEHNMSLSHSTFEVVPNAVDIRFLDAPQITVKKPNFTFLHVSVLNKNKNVSLLVDAFAKSYSHNEKFRLIIGGDGPDRLSLEQRVRRLGISSQVSFSGHLSRQAVMDAMLKADAFVLSSQVETFSVVLIEALATGLPVISTRCGGPEDIVSHGDGILVPRCDIDAMAIAMQHIASRENANNRAARRERCRLRYSPQVLTNRMIQVYTEIVASRSLSCTSLKELM